MRTRSLLGIVFAFGAGTLNVIAANPVSKLQEQITQGTVKLAFDSTLGYLPDLLKALKIPESSQGLVFSKTSLQIDRINPQAPRAIYFNDEVYVGYVTGSDMIEIASVDPELGSQFYTLAQEASKPPSFSTARRGECLQCHQSQKTFDLPGLLVRSVSTLPSGYPDFAQGSGFLSEDSSPMKERWGGWYVSGTMQNDEHMGNQTLRGALESLDTAKGSNITDLKGLVNTKRYLTPNSDIVALMVLAHQAHLHNLISRANLVSRAALAQNAELAPLFKLAPGEWTEGVRARIRDVTDALAKGMVFSEEYALKGEIRGTSSFAEDFQTMGPRDSKGRSLRDLNLKTRLTNYRCSWLVYSPSFDALLPEIKAVVYRRIRELLDNPQGRATLEILNETNAAFRAAR